MPAFVSFNSLLGSLVAPQHRAEELTAPDLERALHGETQRRQDAETELRKLQLKADRYRAALSRSAAKVKLAERNAHELRTLVLELEKTSNRAGEVTASRMLQEENAMLRSRLLALKDEKRRDVELVAEAVLREHDAAARRNR